jgi:hypothetical protein
MPCEVPASRIMHKTTFKRGADSQKPAQRYQYIVTLDTPMWPRKLADAVMMQAEFATSLRSVTDLQNNAHIYGAAYIVPRT